MSDKIDEQLSAWVDGELSSAEQALLMKRVEQDPQLAARWQRYHVIGDSLRGQLPDAMDFTLADRVAAQVTAEVTHHASPAKSAAHWSKPFIGAAIAASVAIVAVLAVRQADLPDPGLQQLAQQETMPKTEDFKRIDPAQLPSAQLANAQPQVVDQLNQYLVNHNEFAARNGRLGMSPQVRIVGYDQPALEQR